MKYSTCLRYPVEFTDFSSLLLWQQFTKWAKEYGPIYSLKAGSQTMVVLTGPKEVKELLDRRSATSSDRPDLHVANEIITNGRHLLAMPYTDRWRLVRKIIHQHLTIKMCEEHHQKVQSAESAHMVSPSTFAAHDVGRATLAHAAYVYVLL